MKRYLVPLAFLLMLARVQAGNIAGADLEYRSLGIDTIHLMLKVYIDCSSTDTTTVVPAINIRTADLQTCFPAVATTYLNLVYSGKVPLTCSGTADACNGGAFQYGLREMRYEGTLYVKQLLGNLPNNCCWLKISYQQSGRTNTLTNIKAGGAFYTEVEVNRCLINSSPVNKNLPLYFVCKGRPVLWSCNMVDSLEKDSISYEWDSALKGDNSSEEYIGTFIKQRPLYFLGWPTASLPAPGGFHLDPQSGNLNFTLSSDQSSVICIRATEWRKAPNGQYIKIGSIRRDVQVHVLACSVGNVIGLQLDESNISYLGNPIVNVCASVPFCLSLKSYSLLSVSDSLIPDTTIIRLENSVPGVNFSSINASSKTQKHDAASFCWTPSADQVNTLPYYFNFVASDNSCPVPATSRRSIGIRVCPQHLKGRIQDSVINDSLHKLKFIPEVLNIYSCIWYVSSRNDGVYEEQTATRYLKGHEPFGYYPAELNIVHKFSKPGRYVVKLFARETFWCGNDTRFLCPTIFYDTINWCPIQVQSDSLILACTSPLATKPISALTSGAIGKIKYQWFQRDSVALIPVPGANAAVFQASTAPGTGNRKYLIKAKDSLGCTAFDSCRVLLTESPQTDFSPKLISKSSFPATVSFTGLSANANQYYWLFGDTASSSNQSNLTNPSHTYTKAGVYTVKLVCANNTPLLTCYDSVGVSGTVIVNNVNTVESTSANPILMYPNPAVDVLRVEWPGIGQYKLAVYSLYGQLLLEKEAEKDTKQEQLQIAELNAGAYLLLITEKEQKQVWKKLFVKE